VSKLGYWTLRGPGPHATDLQHASTRPEQNRITASTPAVAPQPVIEKIGVKSRQVLEPVRQAPDVVIEQVSAFYHDFVAIPWLPEHQPISAGFETPHPLPWTGPNG
jgi:hypothetical protein